MYKGRCIAAEVNAADHPCSVGLVASILPEMDLVAIQSNAWNPTTMPHEISDLIGREFGPAIGLAGQSLVCDITHLRTGQGWL